MSVLFKKNGTWNKSSISIISPVFPALDTTNAVDVDNTMLYSGYTCPSDGYFMSSYADGLPQNTWCVIYLNGATMGQGIYRTSPGGVVPPSCCFPVKKGDVVSSSLKFTNNTSLFFPWSNI